MALFGIGKKKAEKKDSADALDKVVKLDEKMNAKSDKSFSGKVGFTKPKENPKAQNSVGKPSNVEEDLNWDDLLPGFEEKNNDNLSLPEDNSNPFFSVEKGADELDRLASEAGLNISEQPASIPNAPKEEVEKLRKEALNENKKEEKEKEEESTEESKEEQEEGEEIIKQKPKQRKEAYTSYKTFIKANSVFLSQDNYNEFYNSFKEMAEGLASLELDQQEVKDYDNDLKTSGSAFVRYIRAISSIAMQSEDIIRSGGDLNE